jgi:two-component system, chemotaxis family, protein-glutamate methylesterase/glutaminase
MPHKVMIVDDAAMMRLYISSFIKVLPDFKVVAQAANGQEALDKLANGAEVDLILLDIEMPVMDGLEFLRHAKLKTRAKICMLSSVAVAGSPHAPPRPASSARTAWSPSHPAPCRTTSRKRRAANWPTRCGR